MDVRIDSAKPFLRSIALRNDSGKWLGSLQECYDYICQNLAKKQVGLGDLFFLREGDPEDDKKFLARTHSMI